MKKLITVAVPVFNEKANIRPLYTRTSAVCASLTAYDYEIVFFDDGSTDGSREEIEALCAADDHVKAVFYARNFGYSKNIFYAMQQAKGDCAVLLHADLQNPPELIPAFVEKWEAGAQIVQGVKTKSKENKLMFFLRGLFYWIMQHVFGVGLKRHATDFELFDRSFLDILLRVKRNAVFLRGLVLEYGGNVVYIEYTQDRRTKEKTKFNLGKYYDFAMEGIVASSRCLPRRILVVCGALLLLLLAETIVFFAKHGGSLSAPEIENALVLRALLCGVLCVGGLLGFVLEFLAGVLAQSGEKPFVAEEKRVNY